MTSLPRWRKTGRKAPDRHYEGLDRQAWVEIAGLDDNFKQQGSVLVCLTAVGEERDLKHGRVFMGHVIACQDQYYEHWVNTTYGPYRIERVAPIHFCHTHAARCNEKTVYRDVIHGDVFRVLTVDMLDGIKWLTPQHKTRLLAYPEYVAQSKAGLPDPEIENGLGTTPDEVKTGMPGIEGLAAALGGATAALDGTVPEPLLKKPRKEEGHSKSSRCTREELNEEIAARAPRPPQNSALELMSAKGHEKKKKKSKKSKKDDKSERSSSSSSGSDGSVFRMAALPKGVERLRRVHQDHPGRLASLTLLRLQELLQRAQGGGSAVEQNKLPAVARAYLHQIYFQAHGREALGLRNVKEMITLATAIDLICGNDGLRALDVLVQRLKALEVAQSQGGWTQASQLELIMTTDQTAVFRQELRAAQQEVKADWELQRDPRRRPWSGHQGWTDVGSGADANKDSGDKPPENSPKPGKGKGKGKGKKGKRRWT